MLVFAGMAVVTVLVVVLYFTPVLGVRSVAVDGASTLARQRVVEAAGIRMGTPMLRVDSDAIRDRLGRLAKVASARVELSWPSTVRLEIVERSPVAYTRTRQGVWLVDAEGMPFSTVPRTPDLPELRLPRVAPDDPTTDAAMTVLEALPEPVRRELTAVVAEDPGHVRLLLTGGRTVQWGGTAKSDRKAAILPALLTRPGEVYDVTSPALPTVA